MKAIILALSLLMFWQPKNVIFNIASLKGKSIQQVRNTLGKPQSATNPSQAQIRLGMTEGDMTYIKNSYTLIIRYDAGTKKVLDYFITTNDNTNEYKSYLAVCNLTNSKAFEITPIKSNKQPNQYTGVIITPK